MMGSISEVISASTVRLDMRMQRAAIVRDSLRMLAGRLAAGAVTPGTVISDTGDLLAGQARRAGLGQACGVTWADRAGRVAGQGQEHVVERGAVHSEPLHRTATGVDLVKQGPHL